VQPTLHLAQAAHGGQLLARIEALVRPTRSAQSGARIVLPLLALAMTCVASYAYAQIGRPHPDTAVARAASLPSAREAAVRQTFALLGKAGTPVIFDGPDDDLTAEVIAQHGVSRDALWVRRNRQDYVVTAPELVARAHRPWRDAEALDRQVDAFDRELEALDAQSLALDARLQQASAQPASAATDALLRQAADIEAQRRPLIERLQVLRPAQGTAYTRAVQETHALITEALSQGRAKRIPAPTTAQ
jgi:hypothetical protein